MGVWNSTRAPAPRHRPARPSALKTWASMLAVLLAVTVLVLAVLLLGAAERATCRRSLARSRGLVRNDAAAPARAELRVCVGGS